MKKSGREDAPRAVEVLEFIGFWHQNPIFFIIYGNESDKVKDVPINTVVSLYVISEDKRSRQARRRALEGVARLRACSAAAEARIFRLVCDLMPVTHQDQQSGILGRHNTILVRLRKRNCNHLNINNIHQIAPGKWSRRFMLIC